MPKHSSRSISRERGRSKSPSRSRRRSRSSSRDRKRSISREKRRSTSRRRRRSRSSSHDRRRSRSVSRDRRRHSRSRRRSSSSSSSRKRRSISRGRSSSREYRKDRDYHSKSPSSYAGKSRNDQKLYKKSNGGDDSSSRSDSSSESGSETQCTKVLGKVSLDLLDGQLNSSLLSQIDDDSFIPKSFTSKKKIPDKVIIDLQNETISLPILKGDEEEESIFHPNFLGNDTQRLKKWTRKLFNFRQKFYNE